MFVVVFTRQTRNSTKGRLSLDYQQGMAALSIEWPDAHAGTGTISLVLCSVCMQ